MRPPKNSVPASAGSRRAASASDKVDRATVPDPEVQAIRCAVIDRPARDPLSRCTPPIHLLRERRPDRLAYLGTRDPVADNHRPKDGPGSHRAAVFAARRSELRRDRVLWWTRPFTFMVAEPPARATSNRETRPDHARRRSARGDGRRARTPLGAGDHSGARISRLPATDDTPHPGRAPRTSPLTRSLSATDVRPLACASGRPGHPSYGR